MASPESDQIRRTLAKFDPLTAPPLEVQRQEWEASALIPPQTHLEAITIEGLQAEWVGEPARQKVLLFFHGGGFSTGSCITHRDLAARLAVASGVSVLLFNYRLAPEFPFPAALEDSQTVYRWLLAQGFAPQDICLGGDSAGAHLLMSALLGWRDRLPAGVVLFSPWLDLSLQGESMTTRAALDPLVTPSDLAHAASLYVPSSEAHNPLLAPLEADLSGLPPIHIHVGDHEVLLSDATRLADRASGVELHIWEGLWHVFPAWHFPEAQAALEQSGAFIKRIFS